jgi:hypothetical protein
MRIKFAYSIDQEQYVGARGQIATSKPQTAINEEQGAESGNRAESEATKGQPDSWKQHSTGHGGKRRLGSTDRSDRAKRYDQQQCRERDDGRSWRDSQKTRALRKERFRPVHRRQRLRTTARPSGQTDRRASPVELTARAPPQSCCVAPPIRSMTRCQGSSPRPSPDAY